jgi:hypothetical protein
MAGRLRTAFRDAIRVLHTFTLEVIGGFFLALAVIGGTSVFQEYQRWSNGQDGAAWRVALALVFFVAMLGFGLHSFWKARKLQK